jgi:WD40 repeat protein
LGRDTGLLIAPALKHDDIVHWAAFNPDAKKVVTASRDKIVRIWNTEKGELINELRHPAAVYFACFSP